MSKQLNFFEPIENQIRKPDGNTKLVDYGIMQENSDYRVHVGYKSQHIYIFPTKSAVCLLSNNHNLKLRTVTTGEIVTAKGYAVPISLIDGINDILIPHNIYTNYPIAVGSTTSYMGTQATAITVEMLKCGLIPLPLETQIINEKSLQISGTDIIVHSTIKLQVKCDYRAGHKKHGGTGNVFIQVQEANPYKLY
jgi:hypothetical protein